MNGYTGQCLCGRIKYRVDEIGPRIGHCHCSMCRRFHGAAFSTFGEAKAVHFHWLQGEDALSVYQAQNNTKRKFCSHCGSSLIFESAASDSKVVEFSLATLDVAPNISPDAHIHTSSQVEWVTLEDELPKYLFARE